MPTWMCPKCGGVVENYSWDEKPWNSHVCRETGGAVELPEVHQNRGPLPPKPRQNNLSDFF